jgi:hypothetical protein
VGEKYFRVQKQEELLFWRKKVSVNSIAYSNSEVN